MAGWVRRATIIGSSVAWIAACERVVDSDGGGEAGMGGSTAGRGSGGGISGGNAGSSGRCASCGKGGGGAGTSAAGRAGAEAGGGEPAPTDDAGAPGHAGAIGDGGAGSGGVSGGGASGKGSTDGGAAGQGSAGEGNAGNAGGAGDDDGWAGAAGAPANGDCALTESVFLAIPDRVDLVFDEKRCFVYVSTSAGVVQSYDIRRRSLRPLVELEDGLVGIDLSPDQNTLLVADAVSDPYLPDAHSKVFALDLVNRRTRTLRFDTSSLEAGTFMPLFIDDDTFLLTSMFAGSGWVPLREVDLASGADRVLIDVRQNSMLALSADRSTVAVAESNISSGPISHYSLAQDTFEAVRTDWFVFEVAVNRDGTQFAVPVYGGLYVYTYTLSDGFDPEPVELGTYVSQYAIGVAYSPDSDILYVSWINGFEHTSSIQALDSHSFEPLFTLDNDPGLEGTGNFAFVSGRLRVARSGNLIGATIADGVRLYPAR